MSTEDLLTLGLLGAYLTMIAWDFAAPARPFPKLRFWRLKGLAFLVAFVAVSSVLPFFWDAHLGAHRLLDLTGLGTIAGSLVALLVYQVMAYWWHRALHRVPLLWRWFHQMHHSAERVDVFGAFYFSPLDMLGWTAVGSLSMVFVAGVTPEAALVANTVVTFIGFFNHSNVRTPRWLGYVIHRPESHALHHERGVHAFNYADIALVDMIFGTFRNPARWEGEAGFYDGASERVLEMCIGRDVTTPPDGDAERAAVAA
ncbi:MAG: sterol desaturase family protein [Sandaracinaceae bacterium]|nr:sterol desaturase family protein [Sandaracinaceae bacterium]